jgi:parallel beta-helix repeat protein
MKRKALSVLLISWLAVSTLIAIEFICLTKANGMPYTPETLATEQGYIKSNGDVDPPTLPIKRSGNVYMLTNDILNCSLEVEKDNVVIDGNGFLLSAPAFGEKDKNGLTKVAYPLINIWNRSNIIVKNVIFEKYSKGIAIWNSSNIAIIQNTMKKGTTGIFIIWSTNCSVIGNNITDNSYAGVNTYDSTSINISYNTVLENQRWGVLIDYYLSDSKYAALNLSYPSLNNSILENNFINNYVRLRYSGNSDVNTSIYNNYWINASDYWSINASDYWSGAEQSPRANPSSFDPSLFPLLLVTPTDSQMSNTQSDSEFLPIKLVAVSIATTAAVGSGLLVYFKKRKR